MLVRSAYCWMTAVAVAAPLPAGGPPIPGDLEGLVAHLGFDRSEVEDLLEGDVIFLDEDLEEGSDKQMAIGGAILLPATLAEAAALLRGDRGFELDKNVRAYRRLADPPAPADFLGIRFTRQQSDEVEELLEVEAGSTFNFSTAEIAQFDRLGRRLRGRSAKRDAAVREAAAGLLRDLLAERCNAYRAGGLDAIKPYDRGGEERADPGAELAMALAEDTARDARLGPLVSDFYRAVAGYPAPLPEDLRSDFFWSGTSVADRPCFVLTHRLSTVDAGAVLVIERQFYVGHDYNSSQVTMVALPTDRGVLLYYRNRSFTDQVAGRVGSAKKIIGRRRQRGAVVDLLEALRDALD